MKGSIELKHVRDLIELAIAEDVSTGDITTRALFSPHDRSEAVMVAKESGVFCGGDMIRHVYSLIDAAVSVRLECVDGSDVRQGERVACIDGPTIAMLEGERTVLNFIQRMSGIATKTRSLSALCRGSSIAVLDTRKTAPGFRFLDKYAVACGGGRNHRMGLFDMVMIKDNHIKAAGSITRAVEIIRETYGARYEIEVETTGLAEVTEALNAGVDIIMLDNMDREMMEKALKVIGGKVRVEVSGNMNREKLASLKNMAIDYVSMGGLTHSVTAFDLSMKFL